MHVRLEHVGELEDGVGLTEKEAGERTERRRREKKKGRKAYLAALGLVHTLNDGGLLKVRHDCTNEKEKEVR